MKDDIDCPDFVYVKQCPSQAVWLGGISPNITVIDGYETFYMQWHPLSSISKYLGVIPCHQALGDDNN